MEEKRPAKGIITVETTSADEEERGEEASRRLEWLREQGMHPNVLSEWKQDRKRYLYYSEVLPTPFGTRPILYWASNRPELMQAVRDFEDRNGVTVYHCVLTHTTIGDMFAMLYVSGERDEWECDWEDLEEAIPYAYVLNLSDPAMSEIGRIGVEVDRLAGGLVRTA